jgi:uncharacterized RmlC-like cupin family protein
MRRLIVAFLLAPLASAAWLTPAGAQQPRRASSVVHIRRSAIDSAFRAIAATPAGFFHEIPIDDSTRYQMVVASRRAEGAAELHEDWADVVWVRAGEARLRTAPALVQRRSAGAGEWTGVIGQPASERTVAAGDVLVIPAGLAHQWEPRGGAPFSYVVLKVHADSGHRAP